jgi:hypothetical protein
MPVRKGAHSNIKISGSRFYFSVNNAAITNPDADILFPSEMLPLLSPY